MFLTAALQPRLNNKKGTAFVPGVLWRFRQG